MCPRDRIGACSPMSSPGVPEVFPQVREFLSRLQHMRQAEEIWCQFRVK